MGDIISLVSKNLSSKKVSYASIMISLVAVSTLIVRLPVTVTGGYLHFGDAAVMLSGILFGPFVGALAGGIGSSLADVLGGYAHWAPFTLVIKGLEGLIIGLASRKFNKNYIIIIFAVISGVFMALSYFIVEIFLYGYFAALSELLGNIVQIVAGIVGAFVALFIRKISPWEFKNYF